MTARPWRVAVIVGAGLAVGLGVLPVQGRVGADVDVIDTNAAGAAVGVISRIPAQSAGGFVLTSAAITLDKAVAKAAGGTGGDPVETFMASSVDQYRNPTLISAQYPPTRAAPAEASSGGEAGLAALRAAATELPSATAEAEADRAGDEVTLAVRHGRSASSSELGHDGVLVTRAAAVASGVTIGGVATIASAATEAVTTVPPRGRPTTQVKTTITGLQVGGVPARLTDEGLRISDQVPVGPEMLATFNAATAQLAERGIVITAVPAVREAGAERARAEGGAAVVRYRLADQAGGDEELVIAQARSQSTLVMAQERAPLPPRSLTEPPGEPTPAPGPPASAPTGTPADLGGRPPIAPAVVAGAAGASGSGFGPEPVGAGSSFPVAPWDTGRGASASDARAEGQLGLVDRAADPAVARLRRGYSVILLLAAAGAAVHLALQRSRST